MNLELAGKVVVITGGTGDIGRQIVLDFLVEGSNVVCLIRNMDKMKIVEQWIVEMIGTAEHLSSKECNLSDYEDIHAVIDEIVKEFGRIDVLVNCAGHVDEAPLGLLSKDQIDQMIDINFKSPVYLSKAVLKTMFRQKNGSIINISSITAVKKGRGISVYAAAKAGLDSFTRILASEVGRKKIRVNCIRPGLILTKMSKQVVSLLEQNNTLPTCLERPGLPDEISKMVLFLASDKCSSFITGECINIDGGII